MKRWITPADRNAWTSLFTDYRTSAYRLECQQVYSSVAQDENIVQFLTGRPVEVDWTWLDRVTGPQAAAGRGPTKVRIVVEPPTQYTQVEITLYPRMAKAGEDIRILAVPMGEWPVGQPHHDYWLFDDRDLWLMHYHENFHFKGAELVEDPEVVEQHRRWRDLALAEAMPLAEYLSSRRSDDEERTPA